jgi:hypothetical protein
VGTAAEMELVLGLISIVEDSELLVLVLELSDMLVEIGCELVLELGLEPEPGEVSWHLRRCMFRAGGAVLAAKPSQRRSKNSMSDYHRYQSNVLRNGLNDQNIGGAVVP